MARRALAAGAALAVAFVSFVVSAPARADRDDSCAAGPVFAGTIAEVVGDGDDADWWRHPAVPGLYAVSLTSGPADADLLVGNGACSVLCTSELPNAVDQCLARTDDFGLTVGVVSRSQNLSAYSVTVTPVAPAVAACMDGIDNDGDTFVDVGGDAGCASPTDSTEDDGTCSRKLAADVCAEVVVGDEVAKYVLDVPASKTYEVGAYVDSYRFPKPDGGTFDLTCLVVRSRPAVWLNPCRAAGGTYVERHLTLYREEQLPNTPIAATAPVRVCEAVTTLTIDGHGPRDIEGFTLCDARVDTPTV